MTTSRYPLIRNFPEEINNTTSCLSVSHSSSICTPVFCNFFSRFSRPRFDRTARKNHQSYRNTRPRHRLNATIPDARPHIHTGLSLSPLAIRLRDSAVDVWHALTSRARLRSLSAASVAHAIPCDPQQSSYRFSRRPYSTSAPCWIARPEVVFASKEYSLTWQSA